MTKTVVHVLQAMNVGGVEAWLMTLLRTTDPQVIQHEFIVHDQQPGFYDDEIRRLGGKIHYCSRATNPLQHGMKLYKAFRRIQPDVVHSHLHAFSGWVLAVAYLSRVKIRISHCHSNANAQYRSRGYRWYFRSMQTLLAWFATHRIAVSASAAKNLYGRTWQDKPNCRVLCCAIDLQQYDVQHKDATLRQRLGLPDKAFVMGHVGRFEPPKNHQFLIEVFEQVHQRDPNTYLVLVGEGSLKSRIESQVAMLNLSRYVKFLGLRQDVPVLMLSVFDVFVFPSLWEGLGLVAVEAQMAGLPVLASDQVPQEAYCGHLQFMALDKPQWVKTLLDIKNYKGKRSNKKDRTNYDFANSPFVKDSAELYRIYTQ
jgi:glycosyltransferase involved in cell wall biosynthesis